MPAMLDDPANPTIYRVSGAPPYPDPSKPELPVDIVPRQVTLRDRQTIATIIPFASQHEVPQSLVRYLSHQLNKEIEGGDTYPMMDPMPADKFGAYWFQNFGAIMLLGNIEHADLTDDMDWSRECLGSFYIKPNYPGRSSHVCNAGFLVTDASRNRGVGRLMGECYIDWAPKLGYTYSVFNLVYETNVASCKIWDALGFKRIGRVKGCGNLKSHPGQLIDAIIYGRDLVPGESEELVSEERFDKIKFYLKYGKYPAGADRAEKSRLRSAATHYKLLDGDRLMLKDKEVVPDPRRQYEIAREVHVAQHGGINKTTATIAEKYHWSRIKETVSDVIRNCAECKELGKMPAPGGNGGARGRVAAAAAAAAAAAGSSPANTSTSISNNSLSNPSFTNTSASTPPPSVADPIDPQIIGPPPTSHDDPYNHYHPHHTDFQALLNATEAEETAEEAAAVDRDLDMLIEQGDDDEEEDGDEPMGEKEGRDKDVYSIGFING
ncbi:acetyltransferase [Colletotrichum tofieldiae]|nr:acetyltransferase [Colletotrichum tofieldiae]